MQNRQITIEEHPEVSPLSLVLGFSPMLLMAAGAVGYRIIADADLRMACLHITVIFAAAILAFLAGVRRGLSFRTEGGPTAVQLATMFVFFVLALAALFCVFFGFARLAVGVLSVGYCMAMIADPLAATSGEAPLFFRRLRPLQMAIALVSLLSLLI